MATCFDCYGKGYILVRGIDGEREKDPCPAGCERPRAEPSLRPVYIGRTPSGVAWTCYPHHTHTLESFARDLANMRSAFKVAVARQVVNVPPGLALGLRVSKAVRRQMQVAA